MIAAVALVMMAAQARAVPAEPIVLDLAAITAGPVHRIAVAGEQPFPAELVNRLPGAAYVVAQTLQSGGGSSVGLNPSRPDDPPLRSWRDTEGCGDVVPGRGTLRGHRGDAGRGPARRREPASSGAGPLPGAEQIRGGLLRMTGGHAHAQGRGRDRREGGPGEPRRRPSCLHDRLRRLRVVGGRVGAHRPSCARRGTAAPLVATNGTAGALRTGSPTGPSGQLAEVARLVLIGRQPDAVTTLDRAGAKTPTQRAWDHALRLRATADWRILTAPLTASLLERREHYRALERSLGDDTAVEFLGRRNTEALPDWGRIVLTGSVSVERATASRPSCSPWRSRRA